MNRAAKKQSRVYLLLVLGVCYGLFFLALMTQKKGTSPFYDALRTLFTAFPVLAAVLTRRLTNDPSPWNLSFKVWKHPLVWAFSALGVSALIAIGAVIYFAIYPDTYSSAFDYGALIRLAGGSAQGTMDITSPALFWGACVLVSAVFIPIQLLELGEEIGWREYLLPRQIVRYGVRTAVVQNCLLWGFAHMPLIWFGFNYSRANPGAPWSNMALMMLACLSTGVICCYVAITTGNSLYAAIVHGVVNVIGEVPVFLTLRQQSGLMGPNPTGLIGMCGLILCAIVLFARLGKVKSKLICEETME